VGWGERGAESLSFGGGPRASIRSSRTTIVASSIGPAGRAQLARTKADRFVALINLNAGNQCKVTIRARKR
jgi:hypothetical protein